MRILGLDMSTKTGWAILEMKDGSTTLIDQGLIKADILSKDFTLEDVIYLYRANDMATQLLDLCLHNKVDYIYIEQTNGSKFRSSQKLLEFIHCMVLHKFVLFDSNRDLSSIIKYADTSAWRKELGVRMTKEWKTHNRKVRLKKARGKKTLKHVAVKWANETYGLELKLKDNDIADAIAVATYGLINENKVLKETTEDEIASVFK